MNLTASFPHTPFPSDPKLDRFGIANRRPPSSIKDLSATSTLDDLTIGEAFSLLKALTTVLTKDLQDIQQLAITPPSIAQNPAVIFIHSAIVPFADTTAIISILVIQSPRIIEETGDLFNLFPDSALDSRPLKEDPELLARLDMFMNWMKSLFSPLDPYDSLSISDRFKSKPTVDSTPKAPTLSQREFYNRHLRHKDSNAHHLLNTSHGKRHLSHLDGQDPIDASKQHADLLEMSLNLHKDDLSSSDTRAIRCSIKSNRNDARRMTALRTAYTLSRRDDVLKKESRTTAKQVAQLTPGEHVEIGSGWQGENGTAGHANRVKITREASHYKVEIIDTGVPYSPSKQMLPNGKMKPITYSVPLSTFRDQNGELAKPGVDGLRKLMDLQERRAQLEVAEGQIHVNIPKHIWGGTETRATSAYKPQQNGTCASTSRIKTTNIGLSRQGKKLLSKDRDELVLYAMSHRQDTTAVLLRREAERKLAKA